MPYSGPNPATLCGDDVPMTPIIRSFTKKPPIPPGELPATPDDIDLERIVNDPDYRRAVQELLRRWGICNNRKPPPR